MQRSSLAIIIALVVIVIIAGVLALRSAANRSQTQATPSGEENLGQASPMDQSSENTLPSANSSETMSPASQSTDMQNNTVSYTSSGFTPATLTVRAGTTVKFVNNSTEEMWVASNPHPTHTDLPGFDARKGLAKGESYSFTFTKTGAWGYHNHPNPNDKGTIVVQ